MPHGCEDITGHGTNASIACHQRLHGILAWCNSSFQPELQLKCWFVQVNGAVVGSSYTNALLQTSWPVAFNVTVLHTDSV